jgi:hypothetical protein
MMFSNLPDENVSDHPPFLITLASHTNHGAPHQFPYVGAGPRNRHDA